MSILGRITPAILTVLLVSAPVGVASPAASDGDRFLARERSARIENIHTLVRRLTDYDDAMVASGRDDMTRHQRINRLIALDAGWNGTDFESTAVLAALLDDLSRDPDLKISRLYPDVRRARTFALQNMVAAIPDTRLPVSEDLLAMERLLADRAEPGEGPPPAPLPLLSEERRTGASVLLEQTASSAVAVPGAGSRTFLFLPGSRHVLSGDGRDLFIVDLEADGAVERIAFAEAEPPPVVSASGEYLAVVTSTGATREIRVLRRHADRASRTVISGRSIEALAFSPRALMLAVIVDGNLNTIDAAGGEVRRIAGDVAPGSLARWSPDGRYLAIVASGREGDGGRTAVHDAATGARILAGAFPGRLPEWYADSRSLTSLAFSPAPDGMSVLLERRTVDGQGPDHVPLFDLAAGETIEGPAWSPDGRRAAFRIDRAPGGRRAGGFTQSPFFEPLSTMRIARFSIPDSARYDPPVAALPQFAWHPSGRWYAARQEFREGGGLWLHDVLTGDVIPLGGEAAMRPAFSPDGRRVVWIEPTATGERFVYRDLIPVHENLPRSRAFAEEGARALTAGRFPEAARAFRNAVRLAPDEARALQGLGRSYIGSAFDGRFALWKTAAIEAAARTFMRALDKDNTAADIRIDFLDASGRLAWLQGKIESDHFMEVARARLATRPPPGDARRRHAAEIREALVEAVFWDPGNEYTRILLDGMLARFPPETP